MSYALRLLFVFRDKLTPPMARQIRLQRESGKKDSLAD
jgi:hypothetical protein